MPTMFFPLEGALASATATRTAMASSVCHLFQDSLPNPTPATPLADYTTAEADFSGYSAITLTTWNAPGFAPGTGYMIGSPLIQFAVATASPLVENVIAGAYVVDAGGIARITMIFDALVPMQIVGQIIPLNFVWLFPTS